jgi:hypothetical protein
MRQFSWSMELDVRRKQVVSIALCQPTDCLDPNYNTFNRIHNADVGTLTMRIILLASQCSLVLTSYPKS